jgi:predicted transcriptional regulator
LRICFQFKLIMNVNSTHLYERLKALIDFELLCDKEHVYL